MAWTLYFHACGKGIIQNSSPAAQSIQVHSEISPIHTNSRIQATPETALTTNLSMRPLPRFNFSRLKHKQAKGFKSPCMSWGFLKGGAQEILLSISIPISNHAPATAHYLNPLPVGYTTSPALKNSGLLAWASRTPRLFQCIRQVYTRETEVSAHLFHLFFSPLNSHLIYVLIVNTLFSLDKYDFFPSRYTFTLTWSSCGSSWYLSIDFKIAQIQRLDICFPNLQ